MEEDIFDFAGAVIVGGFSWFFGGLDGSIQVLIVFTAIDYVTGVFAAGVAKELSSSVGFKGIARKVTMFAFIGVAHVMDKYFLGDTSTLRTVVSLFYIGNEGLSILENANKIGVPFPEILRNKLLQLRERQDDETEKHKRAKKDK